MFDLLIENPDVASDGRKMALSIVRIIVDYPPSLFGQCEQLDGQI